MPESLTGSMSADTAGMTNAFDTLPARSPSLDSLINPVRPDLFGKTQDGLLEGRAAHLQGLRQAQPERLWAVQSSPFSRPEGESAVHDNDNSATQPRQPNVVIEPDRQHRQTAASKQRAVLQKETLNHAARQPNVVIEPDQQHRQTAAPKQRAVLQKETINRPVRQPDVQIEPDQQYRQTTASKQQAVLQKETINRPAQQPDIQIEPDQQHRQTAASKQRAVLQKEMVAFAARQAVIEAVQANVGETEALPPSRQPDHPKPSSSTATVNRDQAPDVSESAEEEMPVLPRHWVKSKSALKTAESGTRQTTHNDREADLPVEASEGTSAFPLPSPPVILLDTAESTQHLDSVTSPRYVQNDGGSFAENPERKQSVIPAKRDETKSVQAPLHEEAPARKATAPERSETTITAAPIQQAAPGLFSANEADEPSSAHGENVPQVQIGTIEVIVESAPLPVQRSPSPNTGFTRDPGRHYQRRL
jgi:hypothetical protein